MLAELYLIKLCIIYCSKDEASIFLQNQFEKTDIQLLLKDSYLYIIYKGVNMKSILIRTNRKVFVHTFLAHMYVYSVMFNQQMHL